MFFFAAVMPSGLALCVCVARVDQRQGSVQGTDDWGLCRGQMIGVCAGDK